MRPLHPLDVFNWRDPEMLLTRGGMDNLTGTKVTLVLTPWEQTLDSLYTMQSSIEPHWKVDPSYNWAKPRRRR
jgi:hypothetical protein